MARQAPYSVDISPERAKELAEVGGALLLLDVPAGTVVGIDQQTFVVGPRFKGVKMLPPGPHFISCNATSGSSGTDFAPTLGFFVHLAPRSVVVRRWDAQEELLLPIEDADEVERLAAGVRRFDFDAYLAPYDLSSFTTWQSLSGHITPGVIERLSPVAGGNICVTAEADPSLLAPRTAAEARLSEQLASKAAMQEAAEAVSSKGEAADARDEQAGASASGRPPAPPPVKGVGRCFYTRLPRNAKGTGLTPQEVTQLNLDKSRLLDEVIAELYGGDADIMLGELQFAFLAFLLGHSLESFGQWKALLHLALACEEAPLQTCPGFYSKLLAAVRAQLQHCLASGRGPDAAQPSPLGLPMTDELLADSFLKRLFARFYDMLHSAGGRVPPQLQAEASRLQQVLEAGLGWSFSVGELAGESDDEDAPVIVEL
ncbi:AAR2-domain-containing protein [Coccomyxa subellipsoidea C-169]|uniref:AAR2-domain-containing protein n=1 Tax=Coccomyxa subellipsoidea (strain C-169) TaxID=574566 RepID=I0YVX3_COCSC|nr:AAR2-domain-containing protein [Coccomyxa subellipsoidea C-169]EIE22542.1 AAR2-domain-containing protein [Coccomyxa subellipsoidea C-169]|eukprot:XP_005647086.1 AAR2-domain-containing protein [Coccomyxa subellipsoidea C-169]